MAEIHKFWCHSEQAWEEVGNQHFPELPKIVASRSRVFLGGGYLPLHTQEKRPFLLFLGAVRRWRKFSSAGENSCLL